MRKFPLWIILDIKRAICDGAIIGLFFWMLDVTQSPEITIGVALLSLVGRVWRVI
tara:strand:+ start:1675 stop:1839 length:165 start_codon:yes stop_codon:yes gene_type:complete